MSMSSRTVTPNEQIVWMLKGKMEFRLGSEQRVCSQGDVVVIPGGTEHEAWFREDTEVIDFFAPPRAEFLLGGKPNYMSEDSQTSNQVVRPATSLARMNDPSEGIQRSTSTCSTWMSGRRLL